MATTDLKGISNSCIYECEWRKRPINLMSVLRSFVSQLRPGDELTKISLPSELCHPFSMLELISLREMSYFHLLFDINKAEGAEARFIAALKWVSALLQAEVMEKKPFNPVIGEQHLCWVEHSSDNWSEFISEQVSHHPPISSFFIRNKQANVEMQGNLKFNVKFGGNHAAVTTSGPVSIKTSNETFLVDKSVPNMIVNNVVWGVKYVMWNGDITLSCPETGYSATLTSSEVDPSHNRVEGTVFKDGKAIYKIFGQCGVLVEMWPVDDESNKTVLFSPESFETHEITYPPFDAQVEMDSLRLWKTTSDAIIQNDLPTADAEKQKVENSQRARERGRKEAGLPYNAKFFVNVEGNDEESANWTFKNEVSINQEFIDQLREKVKQEAEERAKIIAEHEGSGEVEPADADGNCLLQ